MKGETEMKKTTVNKIILPAAILLLLAAMTALFFQNRAMIEKMDKVLGEADSEIHEIYDTSKISEAYKTKDTDDDKALSAEDAFVLDKASEVISEVIKDDMSDYEKEKAIYDWQVKWVNYQEQNLSPITAGEDQSHLPYGVLKYHQAICVGNATTFKLFMDMLDIPCEIIHSTSEGEHAWNVVQLDGDWYHCDVTFDGGSGEHPGYSMFNVPDSIKDDGSYPWDHNEIPAADGTKYCPKYAEAADLDNLFDIPKAIRKAADQGKSFFSFTLKDAEGFTRDAADYIGNGLYVDGAVLYYDNAYALGGKTVYCYTIDRSMNETPSENTDGKTFEKLDKIMTKLNDGMEPATFEDLYSEENFTVDEKDTL